MYMSDRQKVSSLLFLKIDSLYNIYIIDMILAIFYKRKQMILILI